MINIDNKAFEHMLVDKYKINQDPELAEVLIKEYSSHKIKNTTPSTSLESWISERSILATKNRHDTAHIFGLLGTGSRPGIEPTYICMNSFCWESILSGIDIRTAYKNTALFFQTDQEIVRIGFERKNHDFGERELCRVGLDLSIVINMTELTQNEIKVASDILNEDIHEQMIKNLKHHRAKYNT
tara:strand:- start:2493 stop:3047 length:555 start_codon:yes stop_codon:yes gene_type:complete